MGVAVKWHHRRSLEVFFFDFPAWRLVLEDEVDLKTIGV